MYPAVFLILQYGAAWLAEKAVFYKVCEIEIAESCQEPPIKDGWNVATIHRIRWFLSMLKNFP